ncbi:PP2C family protein-serine/threonine phosphatase [Actinacidiphila sp. bgisy167]|uniref:PP2C family protein-serine/threonine phosphatase n=1 Tax=Actinacidiphila sp. bgisy167 TaxID=3413797 RepID=UPI003D7295E4
MPRKRVVVVGEDPDGDGALVQGLEQAGYTVERARPGQLAPLAAPDAVLLCADLGLKRIAGLGRFFPSAVLVYPGQNVRALELCAQAGFGFVAPPYLPALLRNRLTSSRERGQLAGLVEAAAAEATLRAHERDLLLAQRLQQGFLPERLPSFPGWEFGFRFRPAQHMSGDFYDGFELLDGRRLAFVVADVCDKGLGAALFMAIIRTLLRHAAEDASTLAVCGAGAMPAGVAEHVPVPPTLGLGAGPLLQAVAATNSYLARHHLRQAYFATLFFGLLDPVQGDVLYVNAGHNPAVLIHPGGHRELLHGTGPAVGMMVDSTYAIGHTRLERDAALFLYTDGVVDARSPDNTPFGMPRLLELLGPAESGAVVLQTVDEALARHVAGSPAFDDVTMMVLRRDA